jgi:hypothetical protein
MNGARRSVDSISAGVGPATSAVTGDAGVKEGHGLPGVARD